MQYSLPPKRSFEELVANSIQLWNYSLHMDDLLDEIACDSVFVPVLFEALSQAGHRPTLQANNSGIIEFHDPSKQQQPLPKVHDVIPQSDWPNDHIAQTCELTVASDFAKAKHQAKRFGAVVAQDLQSKLWLQANGFDYIKLHQMPVPNKLMRMKDASQAPLFVGRINLQITMADKLNEICVFLDFDDDFHPLAHKDLLEAAGYSLSPAYSTWEGLSLKLVRPTTGLVYEEWGIGKYETTIIPANVRLTNGPLLFCLSDIQHHIQEPDIGVQFVELCDNLASMDVCFEALKVVVNAYGYGLFVTKSQDEIVWLVDLLGTARVGDVRHFNSETQVLCAFPDEVVMSDDKKNESDDNDDEQ